MRSLLIVATLVLLTAVPAFTRTATDSRATNIRVLEMMSLEEGRFVTGPLSAGAVADTVYFGSWDFSDGPLCNDDGWKPVDSSVPGVDYWHVDDFAGLGGGGWGQLIPIQGNQSLWVGARPDASNLVLCNYATLPGYGNGWDQRFCTKQCLDVTTGVRVVFAARWDPEEGYDGTVIEVDNCDGSWVPTRPTVPEGGFFTGTVADSLHTESIADSLHSGQMRVRFRFTSDGGWSDEDGMWDSDGGMIVDSLSVSDDSGIVVPVELFEDELVGATSSDDWESCNLKGFSYGNNAGNYSNAYADLHQALSLVQEDPCVTELDCVWAFVTGSADNYSCGGFPGQAAVPKCPNADGLYLHE